MYIYRPILAGRVTLSEVNRGDVSLGDLLRLNALMDMEADYEEYYRRKKHA